MELLKSLLVYSKGDYLENLKDFISREYHINTTSHCFLYHLPQINNLNDYDLIIIATHEITSYLINKITQIQSQVFLLLIDEENKGFNLVEHSFFMVRPAQCEKFVKRVLECNAYVSLRELSGNSNDSKLKIYDSHGHSKIDLNKVYRLSSNGAYTNIFTNDKVYYNQSHHLKYYSDKLNDSFYRISNAHIVNAKFIIDYANKRDSFVIMPDNLKIRITRNYRTVLDSIIKKYKLSMAFFVSFSTSSLMLSVKEVCVL